MNIKRILSIISAAVLILCAALPVAALGQPVIQNNDFLPKDRTFIGWNGCCVYINPNGSFEHNENGATVSVSFGLGDKATLSAEDYPYPVSTHTYSEDGIGYTLEQFALGDESGAVCVYSRFTVYNSKSEAISFPSVTGTVPIASVPQKIEANKSAFCDYIVSVKAADGAVPAGLKNETFESAKEKMIAHWDTYLEGTLFISGFETTLQSIANSYSNELIERAICNTVTPSVALSSGVFPSAQTLKTTKESVYSCALALMKTNNTAAAQELFQDISNIAQIIVFEDDKLPYTSLSENLDALLTLQSFAYITKVLYPGEAISSEALDRAVALSENIAAFIENTEKDLPYEWEAYSQAKADRSVALTVTGAYEKTFDAENFASARALCQWYTKSAVFSASASKELIRLAGDANDYYSTVEDPSALMLSLFAEREDGTLIIGKGAPHSLLSANSSVTLKNITLSSGHTATLTVKASKNTVDITFSGAVAVPFQIEFPVFKNNIEYASVGFDSESGIVTAPAGTSNVTVRLTENISDTENSRNAGANLEKVISDAYSKNVDDPTTVSKELFDAALDRAVNARNATKDEKLDAANELKTATASLSPMTAGYTHTIPESGEYAGTLTKSEIYQKFSLPASGTVSSLFVKGEYTDSISAAVYTLRGDAYTTDELRAETYGKETDGGIVFELDFEAEGDTVYVLCIFSEDEDISLFLERSDTDTAHTVEAGTVSVYTGASLSMEFTVIQADRKGLDSFYSTCLTADISGYTKESRKALSSKMDEAKKILCTPSVTQEEYNKVYGDLKGAYDGLDTYASQDKIEGTPIVGLVLICIVIVLLIATFFSAMAARKKMDPDS